MSEWISVEDRLPPDRLIGHEVLFFRPLAKLSNDKPIAVKVYLKNHQGCWDKTVPDGIDPFNPTDGSCHITHWMPLPAPPNENNS